MEIEKEFYLGDGLYASHDGYMYTLRAPRGGGDQFVHLEPDVLTMFLRYVETIADVKITVRKNSNPEDL